MKLKICLSWVISLIIIGLIAIYVKQHLPEFTKIFQLSPFPLMVLVFMIFLNLVLLGCFTKVLLDSFEVKLTFREWFGLSVVSTMGNYLMPFRGGAGIRAVYLKKRHNFTYATFLSTMAALYLITFFVNSLIGLICMGLIYLHYGIFNLPLFSFFSVAFFVLSLIIIFSPQIPNFGNRCLNTISNFVNSWYRIKSNQKLAFKLLVIILLISMVKLYSIYFAFQAFSIDISMLKSLLISTLLSFSTLINLTPGALGITEGVIILGAKIFSITPAQSLLVAGLIRVVTLFFVFILGPIFSYLLLGSNSETNIK